MVRGLGVAVFVVAAVLLTSIGGAGIAASPITLPAMYLLVRLRPTLPFRIAGMVIGGLTGLEAGWGLSYLVYGPDNPSVWVVGFIAMVATVVIFAIVPRPSTGQLDHLRGADRGQFS